MRFGVSAAVLAGLLLTGCDQLGGGNNSSAAAGSGNAAAPAPSGNGVSGYDFNTSAGPAAPAPAPQSGATTQLTREFVVGSWSVTGNCQQPEFVFNADGTVSRGGQNYQWTVSGGNLVVNRVGETESETTPVQVVDQQNMVVTSSEGPIPLRRC